MTLIKRKIKILTDCRDCSSYYNPGATGLNSTDPKKSFFEPRCEKIGKGLDILNKADGNYTVIIHDDCPLEDVPTQKHYTGTRENRSV